MPATKRYFTVEEMDDVEDGCGPVHRVVARDMNHVIEILTDADFCDAAKLYITEMPAAAAADLKVHDYDHEPKPFPLTEAPLGAIYSPEF